MIIKRKNGWYVVSETTGRVLGGPYASREQAQRRLEQVEYFKNKKRRA